MTDSVDRHKRQRRNKPGPSPEQLEERFTLDVEPEEALRKILAGAGVKKKPSKPEKDG